MGGQSFSAGLILVFFIGINPARVGRRGGSGGVRAPVRWWLRGLGGLDGYEITGPAGEVLVGGAVLATDLGP